MGGNFQQETRVMTPFRSSYGWQYSHSLPHSNCQTMGAHPIILGFAHNNNYIIYIYIHMQYYVITIYILLTSHQHPILSDWINNNNNHQHGQIVACHECILPGSEKPGRAGCRGPDQPMLKSSMLWLQWLGFIVIDIYDMFINKHTKLGFIVTRVYD